MSDLRKASEALINHWEAGEFKNCTGDMAGHIQVLREALAQSDDLQTAVERGTQAWADVSDATEWVEELRGYDIPQVTPEVNEPEGWVKIDEVRQYLNSVGCATIYKTAGEDRVPLYSAPQREWVGLTANEVYECWKSGDVVAAVEAKLKEKNT